MKKILSITIFVILSVGCFAQTVHKSKNINTLIKQSDVLRIIKTLTADDMQGRGSFTPGIEKAARFIGSEYKKIDLKPLKGDSGYRQAFTMIKASAVKTTVSINGTNISPDSIAASGRDSFSWTNLTDAEIVKVTPDKDLRAEYIKASKSGKNTLLLVDPKFTGTFERVQSLYKNGKVTFKDDPKNNNQQVVFILGKFDEVKSINVNCEIKSQELPLFNMVGVIPGKTKPTKYVVFGGHYDHLGIIKPMDGDSIANGADDDASGTTAVISLARYYKKMHNNARTLIFVAFTAEEIGEFGSQYFAKTVDARKVVAMFNIEMIGKASKFGENSAFITGFERSDFGPILQRNLKNTKFKFYPDPYPAQNLFYRSDNASLAKVGVPAHTISTDQIDIDKYYHTVKDELSTLDVSNITSTIRAIALSSKTIVSAHDTPKRIPKLEE